MNGHSGAAGTACKDQLSSVGACAWTSVSALGGRSSALAAQHVVRNTGNPSRRRVFAPIASAP
eukprot:1586807-Prymnesium_polylepis.1